MTEYGKDIAPDTFRIERVLAAPIERVWSYLVDTDKRSRWFTAGDNLTAVGQAFTFAFGHHRITDEKPPARWAKMDGSQPDTLMTGRVLAFEPPRKLGITWGDGDEHVSEVLFELTSEGDRTRLVLTHSRIDKRANFVDFAGGWTAHLDALEDVIAGRKPRFWSYVLKANDAYEKIVPQ